MIVMGHSHIVAVVKAAHSAGVDIRPIQMKTLNKASLMEGRSLHADFLCTVQDMIVEDRSRHFFSFIGGALHTALGLIQHPEPFDFVVPERRDLPLDRTATVLPYDALRATMERRLKFELRIMAELHRALDVPVVHFSAPPPVEDKDFVEATLPKRIKEEGAKFGTSAAPLRLKLWMVESDIVRRKCEEEGIEFVPPPSIAMDGDYLSEGFRKDPSHGNEAYGMLIVERMKSYRQ